MKWKKGMRVEYTWSNMGHKPPSTNQGTIVTAHRNGTVTIVWDNSNYGRPMYWGFGEGLTVISPTQNT